MELIVRLDAIRLDAEGNGAPSKLELTYEDETGLITIAGFQLEAEMLRLGLEKAAPDVWLARSAPATAVAAATPGWNGHTTANGLHIDHHGSVVRPPVMDENGRRLSARYTMAALKPDPGIPVDLLNSGESGDEAV